jgi:hypothetical protein
MVKNNEKPMTGQGALLLLLNGAVTEYTTSKSWSFLGHATENVNAKCLLEPTWNTEVLRMLSFLHTLLVLD